ncbi:MAG: response regulator [Deltaproteobacteria bacterium]|nr:response regulator [Deltaproteobacteria bacterium]
MERRYRVLVVDDDADVRDTLSQILTEMGQIEVECVQDGEAGFALVGKRRFDLVFVDMCLPGMSGLELLRLIKGRAPELVVVMVTGFPSVESAIQSMKDGAGDFITKPFRFQQIEHVVHKLLLTRPAGESEIYRGGMTAGDQNIDTKLGRKIKELSILYSISDSMGTADFDVDRFYEKIVDMASTITGAERTSLMILDPDANELRIKAAKGLSQKIVGSARVPLGTGVAGRVVTSGRPLFVKNSGSSSRAGRKSYRTGSYVSIPLTIKGETFGVLNVTDKCDGSHFDEGEVLLLLTLVKRAALNIENSMLYEALYDSLVDTLQCLVATLEAKDRYTHRHSERVTDLATEVARKMGCPREEIEGLRLAGLLHDIGKIGIHDAVLQKSDGLTEEEFGLIKTHPIIGENIIRPLALLPVETAVVRNHHERWDGKGYPDGLAGGDIPLLARILAVADSYDAMTSDRPYRPAKTPEEAARELKRCAGSQFDRTVVEAFLQMDLSNPAHRAA